ncbi:TetR/AcrR family transcriptional regulator [Sciscionella sediminilitoris]|uniref:TetR/AcrR family transcriptional regulator n=1 Tax=Sciscionella sediminilitoris TaxID=1445613 RepID=UPI0004DFC79F|nr:TetR/AcrR family transcriptional regulator [Sciscionella sp. SE31]
MELVNEEASGRPKRLPREVRERQILDAAVSVFSAHGYHAASMDEVSATAGISKPMIYSYLGSKEDLFAACIRRELDRLLVAIADRAKPGLPADQQLWYGVLAFFEFIGANKDSWSVLHRQASEHGGPFAAEHRLLRTRAIELVAALVISAAGRSEHSEIGAAAQRTGESLAAAVVGAGESLADWWLDNPQESARHLAERMMNVVWAGFGNLMDGKVWAPPPEADE